WRFFCDFSAESVAAREAEPERTPEESLVVRREGRKCARSPACVDPLRRGASTGEHPTGRAASVTGLRPSTTRSNNETMTENDQKQLGKTLWAIADQLRGSMNADDFRDYMLSFLFL